MGSDFDRFSPNLPTVVRPPGVARPAAKGITLRERERVIAEKRARYASRTAQAVLAMDCSGSMAQASKLDHAKRGALEFAESAVEKGYAVGLVRFGDGAAVVCDPSRELDVLKASVSGFSAWGRTQMDAGLEAADRMLFAATAMGGAVIVVTDGFPDDPGRALAVAARLKERKVQIICVGTLDADADFLRQLASALDLARVVADQDLGTAVKDASRYLPRASRAKD
jgi:Mg-chelatase subunit ChlD